MAKVIGIGETVFDILFKNDTPVKAVPGGSVYNCIISLGRCGVPAEFISEVGDDRIGRIILEHLRENNVDTSAVCCFSGGKSPLALAFLNENNDAEYIFYKDYPNTRLEVEFPAIKEGDIVVYGSYFVLNPVLRAKTKAFLEYAHEQGAVLFYDINFRKNHVTERIKLAEALIENLELADIVRGSADDFRYCPNFIFTNGGGDVRFFTRGVNAVYPVKKVEVVSTVGAGDNFNAGVLYGLSKAGMTREKLAQLTAAEWDGIISKGLDFSAHACTLIENYVDKAWAQDYIKE